MFISPLPSIVVCPQVYSDVCPVIHVMVLWTCYSYSINLLLWILQPAFSQFEINEGGIVK